MEYADGLKVLEIIHQRNILRRIVIPNRINKLSYKYFLKYSVLKIFSFIRPCACSRCEWVKPVIRVSNTCADMDP